MGCTGPPCPVDGVWDEWGDWGACDEQCGEGRHIRQRQALTPAQYGGKLLEGPSAESKTCKDKECPVDCVLTDFAPVSACSVSCGAGTMKEQRTIETPQAHNGAPCDAPLEQDVDCSGDPCPVDCVWGQWSGFGSCSKTCGEGEEMRSRGKEIEAENGGVECEGETEETRTCELTSCPIDGVWGEW